MRINVEGDTEIGAYFVSFTHVRDGKNHHTYVRMDDIKSFDNTLESHDRSTRWRLETNSGDVYYTLNSFIDIMDTNKWFPRQREGTKTGFVMRELLYRTNEEQEREAILANDH